jgi:uncharacterized membrane protein (DUF4010 family)
MDPYFAIERLAVALGLGLLVGLQRERVKTPLAGIRTFALITLFGAMSGLLAPALGGWVVGLGVAALAGVVMAGNFIRRRPRQQDPGVTTEIAALVMYAVGVYVALFDPAPAIVVGGVVALLLHLKRPMHSFVARIGEADLRAIMQFVLIALVILPVLPDETYGPFDVLNPRQVWWMVVLIVGISLGGYVAYKLLGQQSGTLLSGLLGGLISSTATTVSYAKRAVSSADAVLPAAAVILVASAISFVRVMVELAVVAPSHRLEMLLPLGGMLAGFIVFSAAAFFASRRSAGALPQQENPTELRTALVFAAMYALVLLAVAATKTYVGDLGLYVLAIISGLTDMDAITLSTGRLVESAYIGSALGWRIVLVASMSNLLFKAGMVAALGQRRLLIWVGGFYLLAIVLGLGLLLLWPT